MTRFHVDPATGATGPCGATQGKCPYRGDTPDANHYATEGEAKKAGEVIMSNLYGGFSTNSKSVKTFETPSKNIVEDERGDVIGWVGSRKLAGEIDRHDVARGTRQDIRAAIAAGVLPKDTKYRVDTSGESIITNINFGDIEDQYNYKKEKDGTVSRFLKPEYSNVMGKVKAIIESHTYGTLNKESGEIETKHIPIVIVSNSNSINARERETKAQRDTDDYVSEAKLDGTTPAEIFASDEYLRLKEIEKKAVHEYDYQYERRRLEELYVSSGRIPDWKAINNESRTRADQYVRDNF